MKRRNLIVSIVAVLAISVCLLVSCGPERSETVSLAPVTPEPGPTATVEPTKPPTSTVVPSTEPSTTPEQTATPEPTSTPTQTPEPTFTPEPTEPPSLLERLGLVQGEPDLNVLAERLLTIEDMPVGWSAKAAEIEERSGEGTYDPFCKEGLPSRSIGHVSVDFESGGLFGPFISEYINVYPSADDAISSFAEFNSAANDCPQYINDEGGEFTVSPLSFPAYGDESFAFRSTSEGFTRDSVDVRVGEILISISQFGLSTDAELQQTLVEEALSKLDR